MKKTRLTRLIEYIPPILILSYFIIHNIFLVMISITLSLYLININIINNIKRSISKNFFKKVSKDSNKKDKKKISNTINTKSTKEDTKLTLVEEIEELGFIPSLAKKNNTNAA